MAEYIPKQAAIDAMKQLPHEYGTKEQRARTGGIAACQMVVRNLEPADVRPVVRGRWKKNDNGTYSCERCHSWIPEEQWHYANWCLYCGADMRGGDV